MERFPGPNQGIIRIEATESFRPKSNDSEGDVLVDPELPRNIQGLLCKEEERLCHRERSPVGPGRLMITILLPARYHGSDRVASRTWRRLKDAAAHAAQGVREPDQCALSDWPPRKKC